MKQGEKIQIRKIVPVAAKISVGKSKFLNVIYNIDFLECKEGIATKFVNILRYNPNIKNPRFYHLVLIKNGDNYGFYQDLNEFYEGKEKIIEANKNINKKLRDEKNINYENLFYMTEINKNPFIKDEEYLLDHDLCDLPGLSEYQGNQKSQAQSKAELNQKEFDSSNGNGQKMQLVSTSKKDKINSKYKKYQKLDFDTFNKEIEMIDLNEEKKIEKEENKEDEILYKIKIEENTYLSEIFRIIKNYIDSIIIILSVENYYFKENFELIAKLHKITEKPILNSLVLLNKIDLSQDPENDEKKCRGLLIKNFQKFQTFNINFNTFISLSVEQVQNELLMDTSFRHLIFYHFQNCLSIAKKDNSKAEANKASFIFHLKNIIEKEKKIEINDLKLKIEQLNKENNIFELNKEIKSIIKDLKEKLKDTNMNEKIRLDISDTDLQNIDNNEESNEDEEEEEEKDESQKLNNYIEKNPINIIKLLYIYFKQKLFIPPLSESTKNLLQYFTNKKINYSGNNYYLEEKETENMKLNFEMENHLSSLHNKLLNSNIQSRIINNLKMKIINISENIIKSQKIFIPFLGPSNAGKTTIINGIIGRNILPTALNECTKRGIIIGYSSLPDDEITISKANLIAKQILNNDYYYFKKGNIICKGLRNVRQTLEGLNYGFTDRQEDCLYYIHTKIKLFDELGLDDSLKKKIYLIDLPGYGSENNFLEYEITQNLINISKCFVFVVRNSVIKENNTKKLIEKIFKEIKEIKGKIDSGIIKSCFFILNNNNSQKITEEDLKSTRKDILELLDINCDIDDGNKYDINLSFFNAKLYCNYCDNFIYFFNLKETLKNEFNNYLERKENLYKLPDINKYKVYKSFLDFLYNQLCDKIKDIFGIKIKTQKQKPFKIAENIQKELNNIIKDFIDEGYVKMVDTMKNENKIGQLLTFGQEKIANLDLLKESNFEEFKKIINFQFNYINNNIKEDTSKKIDDLLSSFDDVFQTDFTARKENLDDIHSLEKEMTTIKLKLFEIYSNNDVEINNYLNAYDKFLYVFLNDKKENIKDSLKTMDSNQFLKLIDKELEKNLGEMNKRIINLLNEINKKSITIFQEGCDKIKEFSKGKISLKMKENFFDYLINKIGDKDKNIYSQIEIKIKSTRNIFKIYNEKGFSDFIKSAFSNYHYIINNIEIILNDFKFKANYIFNLITKNLVIYIRKLSNKLSEGVSLSTTQFTDEQLKSWQEVKEYYMLDIRKKIENTKNKLFNSEESI